ncbi:hypothetical protein [Nocardia sp. CA-120079]|uniref:hypothetical protein n=1 Tax=Nocardia sp. CA-120079 TaxID=3239974 RepID=UPI003D9621AD
MKTTTALAEALTEFRVVETPQDLALFGGTGAAAVDPLCARIICASSPPTTKRVCLQADRLTKGRAHRCGR